MIIIFLGPPGAGKGTQAKLVAEKNNLPHFSIGQLLREEYEKKTKEGMEGEKYWGERGVNVPTRISFTILKKYLEKKNSFILDNFPRTKENLNTLTKYLKGRNLKIDFVFHLRILQETGETRLLKRGKKDEINGQKRTDETPRLIKIRQNKGYGDNIKTILSFFKKQKVLYEIDAEKSIIAVRKKIFEIIDKSEKRR